MVINVIETALNVALHKPLDAGKGLLNYGTYIIDIKTYVKPRIFDELYWLHVDVYEKLSQAIERVRINSAYAVGSYGISTIMQNTTPEEDHPALIQRLWQQIKGEIQDFLESIDYDVDKFCNHVVSTTPPEKKNIVYGMSEIYLQKYKLAQQTALLPKEERNMQPFLNPKTGKPFYDQNKFFGRLVRFCEEQNAKEQELAQGDTKKTTVKDKNERER